MDKNLELIENLFRGDSSLEIRLGSFEGPPESKIFYGFFVKYSPDFDEGYHKYPLGASRSLEKVLQQMMEDLPNELLSNDKS